MSQFFRNEMKKQHSLTDTQRETILFRGCRPVENPNPKTGGGPPIIEQ
jgi:hypothetical protein